MVSQPMLKLALQKTTQEKAPSWESSEYYHCIKKKKIRFLSNRQEHRKDSTLVGLNIQLPGNTHIHCFKPGETCIMTNVEGGTVTHACNPSTSEADREVS